jgi:hypothetical protein
MILGYTEVEGGIERGSKGNEDIITRRDGGHLQSGRRKKRKEEEVKETDGLLQHSTSQAKVAVPE